MTKSFVNLNTNACIKYAPNEYFPNTFKYLLINVYLDNIFCVTKNKIIIEAIDANIVNGFNTTIRIKFESQTNSNFCLQ